MMTHRLAKRKKPGIPGSVLICFLRRCLWRSAPKIRFYGLYPISRISSSLPIWLSPISSRGMFAWWKASARALTSGDNWTCRVSPSLIGLSTYTWSFIPSGAGIVIVRSFNVACQPRLARISTNSLAKFRGSVAFIGERTSIFPFGRSLRNSLRAFRCSGDNVRFFNFASSNSATALFSSRSAIRSFCAAICWLFLSFTFLPNTTVAAATRNVSPIKPALAICAAIYQSSRVQDIIFHLAVLFAVVCVLSGCGLVIREIIRARRSK
jgi:hypothetical protein